MAVNNEIKNDNLIYLHLQTVSLGSDVWSSSWQRNFSTMIKKTDKFTRNMRRDGDHNNNNKKYKEISELPV